MKSLFLNRICLIAANVLLGGVIAAETFRCGLAPLGNGTLGISIPDTGLFSVFFIYFVFSAVEFAFSFKDRAAFAIVAVLKTIVTVFIIYAVCGHAFSAGFIESNINGTFKDNIWYTVSVSVFIGIVALAFIAETVFFALDIKKRMNK